LIIWDNPAADVTPRVIDVPGIRGLALSPDGRTLAAAIALQNSESSVVLYNPDDGQPVRRLCSNTGRIVELAYAPHGRTLVAGFANAPIQMIDTNTGEVTTVAGTEKGAHMLSFNAAGTVLAVARLVYPHERVFAHQFANQVALIDPESGQLMSKFRHGQVDRETHGLAMSPDGRLLAISSVDKTNTPGPVLLWHIESGRTIMTLRPFGFHPDRLHFLPGGEFLAATGYQAPDHTKRGTFLWRLGPARQPQPAN
jgi:WD40 repeat protein